MPDWQSITSQLQSQQGIYLGQPQVQAVGGGCINAAYYLHYEQAADAEYFVKLNRPDGLDMFQAEVAGLDEILASHTITVPEPLLSGIAGDDAFLVMRYLPLQGHGNAALLGEKLAAMHHTQADQFGWVRDNTIGSTPQINTPSSDWVAFWCQHRLGFQLLLAQRNGAGGKVISRGERVLESVPKLFTDYSPPPSLLHGDLWGGNVGYLAGGEPVIFDPATYFGDREADIAMTELFGGFGTDFYAAYQASWPLDAGYAVRKILYNLYHILNHFNLFGGGYLQQAGSMIDRLQAELH